MPISLLKNERPAEIPARMRIFSSLFSWYIDVKAIVSIKKKLAALSIKIIELSCIAKGKNAKMEPARTDSREFFLSKYIIKIVEKVPNKIGRSLGKPIIRNGISKRAKSGG